MWYSQSQRQSFTFFNDWHEWKQVDKAGHFFSAFHLSAGTAQILKKYNLREKKANAWGAATGFLLLLPVEILDGFSAGYGASLPDLAANLSGSAFYYLQASWWHEVRIQPKFSFQRTGYPDLRDDDTLGNGLISEMLKDYNGQTYWLSVNMDRFISFPRWLNLVVGYGANGMVYARDQQNEAAGFKAYRQYYVGLDIDLSHIKTRSKTLNTLLFIVNTVKLPAPALEFSDSGSKWHWLMF
ncbi:MAG: YfiM family protein [Cyclobacteriaceae bacterium]|nr:YfiM family protein [Cyclobacteriaceae bacterium]MCX7636797.1 YfiM family protein [Cyclobacteriaceae bacterium]MDW8331312.1 DUF2279 domain-containing protein [Cyclobacteriaceae bacterium]